MTKYAVTNLTTGYVYTIEAYDVTDAISRARRQGYVDGYYSVHVLNFSRQG